MKYFVDMIIGAIVVFIVKGFFEDMKTQVKASVDSISSAKRDFSDKILEITKEQRNIYDNMLTKFSNWEDRIKKIIDDSSSNTYKDRSDVDVKTMLLQSFAELDSDIKKDVLTLKREMSEIEDEIKDLQDGSHDKEIVRQILNSISRMNTQKNKDFLRVEDKIGKMYAVVKTLINDHRKLENKFNTFSESMAVKIRISEDKKKHS
jgi:hypothetical protein